MEIIKKIASNIDEELEDAQKYIDCAIKEKEKHPTLAELYYKLSTEEMKHADMLHDEVVRIIGEYKKSNEVPPAMQAIYDYIHEREMEWASKIKYKQDHFR